MAVDERYISDVEAILSHRYDNGADLWTTPDKRIIKGAPFSTIECIMYLLELGMAPDEPVLKAAADLIFEAWSEDGRFHVYPTGAVYPCQTVMATATLCHLGYAGDPRIRETFLHLLNTRHTDGGWRCKKFSFGRGPETECSNPLPTLSALDAFRFSDEFREEPSLSEAVEFLLEHWRIRTPVGPCHYGMGTLFMQVEYPFRNYNLFVYVYVLSFYKKSRTDKRFLEALEALERKMIDGQIVVERVGQKLADLSFCKKGQTSELATRRYREIMANMGR